MKTIKSDFKKGTVKLRVENADDLWYLSHIIEPRDFVRGKTTRKIRIGDSDNAKSTKKTITLSIEAEQVEFTSSALRVLGKVKEGTDDIPTDSYHSISVEIGHEITIEKPTWLAYQRQKLKEASEEQHKYLVLIFDRDEAIFALTKKSGHQVLVEFKGDVQKKSKKVEVKKDFHQAMIEMLEQYQSRYNPEAIIIASPAFYKDDLFKKLNSEIKKNVVLAICSSANKRAIDEVLARPEVAKVLKSSRARHELLLMEELLQEIEKENLAVYGWKDVKNAVEAGAVKDFLISDEFIQKRREKNKFTEINEAMKKIDSLNGKIHVLSSNLESGHKLNGLGGVAAILRFKVEWK